MELDVSINNVFRGRGFVLFWIPCSEKIMIKIITLLVYFRSRKEIKSLKYMLIKIRFSNHRHGYDFLCYNLLNY